MAVVGEDNRVWRPSNIKIVIIVSLLVLFVALGVHKIKDYRQDQELLNLTFTSHEIKGPGVPDCVSPSIHEFPRDLFSQEERQNGWVIVHVLITAYLCATLAMVCDEYFVPSLEHISDYLKIPTDVAGATFMAIGTSSPELYSAMIGSFITEGDIGIGTIVGSAVFNILGVTSVTGLILWRTEASVDWYPISRDCLIYAMSVISLAVIIRDNIVNSSESVLLFLMFGFYITVMYYNSECERWSMVKMDYFKKWWKNECICNPETNEISRTGDCNTCGRINHLTRRRRSFKIPKYIKSVEKNGTAAIHPSELSNVTEDKNRNGDESSESQNSILGMLWTVIMWPISVLLSITIPDVQKPGSKDMFALTFFMSVVWIGVISYLCSWMVTIIGHTFELPDSVAGITILAAGISVPEIIASIIIVRNGMANMAICNLIGSNIFDVLFCLGAPWLLKTTMVSKSGTLVINSSALTYTTITLLSTVLLLFLTLNLAGWKLNWKVGLVCLGLYGVFLVIACMCELNMFGQMNPPSCVSVS